LPAVNFVFTLNDRKIAEGWVSHKFRYYVYEARFNDDRLHSHSLRHTFTSWLVQDGVSLYEVQKLLGHSSIAVTEQLRENGEQAEGELELRDMPSSRQATSKGVAPLSSFRAIPFHANYL
jgi:integrase